MSVLRSLFRQTGRVLQKRMQPPSFGRPAAQMLWDFSKEDDCKDWFARTDKDLGGSSTAELTPSEEGFVRFRGQLSTKLPAKGNITRSGYCIMRSKTQPRSLFGEVNYDLSEFNGLEIELRGDGRTYIANLHTSGFRDEDLYQAFVYTRGGPLWQTVQIPFSEFLLTSMGYVQNEQTLINPTRVRTVGLLLADEMDGPFELDVKSIRAINMRKEMPNMTADDPPPPAAPRRREGGRG